MTQSSNDRGAQSISTKVILDNLYIRVKMMLLFGRALTAWGKHLMVMSFLILVFSAALFFFYAQAICERALQHEFSQPYFQKVIQAIQLEFPSLRDASASNSSLDHEHTRLALECDFLTLSYLLKNGDRTRHRLSRAEKALFLYFRFLMFSLPIRHALNLRESKSVLKLATILQYFANVVGENLSVTSFSHAVSGVES
jgi:hypothetical protein